MGDDKYLYTNTMNMPKKITAENVKQISTPTINSRIEQPVLFDDSPDTTALLKDELKRREDEVIERRHQAELTLGGKALEESRKANRIADDAASSAWHSRWVAVAALIVAILVALFNLWQWAHPQPGG